MNLLPQEIKENLPLLYAQENEKDPTVHIKYFDPTGSWTWYVLEGEEVDNDFLFFGFVIGHEAELGYFRLSDLKTAKRGIKGLARLPIEQDLTFTPCKLSEIKRFHSLK